MQQAWIEVANLNGASLRGVDLGDCRGSVADIAGCKIDADTLRRSSGWGASRILQCHNAGALLVDFPKAWPADVVKLILQKTEGLTLTFDIRLHRLDPAAFELLLSEILGADTGATVEELSPADTAGPAFIRINGKDPDQLSTLAQKFYDRIWRSVAAEVDRNALERVMSRGMAAVIERLDALRDGWVGASLNHPAITTAPAGAIQRQDPASRIADLDLVVAEENRMRALEQLLVRLFEPGALHAWMDIEFGVEVASGLPGPTASHAVVVAETVALLSRLGRIDRPLFQRLAAVHSNAAEAVWAVAGKWAGMGDGELGSGGAACGDVSVRRPHLGA